MGHAERKMINFAEVETEAQAAGAAEAREETEAEAETEAEDAKGIEKAIISMFKVSRPIADPPAGYLSALEEAIYNAFARLGIPFERVDTDPGLTMEDCENISAAIGVRVVKTVFLCNRQQTAFWLYVTSDDKPFVTRDFCAALGGIPRVSFAPSEKLRELTGVEAGATTILSAVLPECAPVQLVMDKPIAEGEWFACTDGTATCFVKIRTGDLLEKYLPATGHSLTII